MGKIGRRLTPDAAVLDDLISASASGGNSGSSVRYHERVIARARQEQADGQNPGAVALAKRIFQVRTAEIATVKGLLVK